jgi:hypothetical protein
MSAPPFIATRAVVSDPPGEPTSIALYDDAGALASAQLDPATCVDVASDLLNAARIRLGRGAAAEPRGSQHAGAEGEAARVVAVRTSTPLCGQKIGSAGSRS